MNTQTQRFSPQHRQTPSSSAQQPSFGQRSGVNQSPSSQSAPMNRRPVPSANQDMQSPMSQGPVNNGPHQADSHHSNSCNNQPRDVVQIRNHMYKVHGKNAALGVTGDTKLKDSEEHLVDENGQKNEFHTFRLEAAGSNNSGNRTYDWSKKVIIQLTSDELPLFIGVCLGHFHSIKFGNHGVGNNGKKFFEFEHQGGNGFIKIGQFDPNGGSNHTIHSIRIPLPQMLHIGLMALSQYQRNFAGVDTQALIQSISMMCQHYINSGVSEIKDRI